MDQIQMFIILLILCLLIGVYVWIALWIYKRYQLMSILMRNGIPGNKPNLIFGNLLEMKGLSVIERQKKLIEKFGKIVGYYAGAKPNILVADPELVKRILIKDFHNFTNRSHFLEMVNPYPNGGDSIFLLRDYRWKQIRSLLSPAFSISKLKAMTPIIEESIDTFLDIIREKSITEEEFNIHESFQRLTVETILKTAFGTKIDAQKGDNNNLLMYSLLFGKVKMNKLVILLLLCFPESSRLINSIKGTIQRISSFMGITPFKFLWNTCTEMIKLRKDHPSFIRNDILQAMLDSELDDEENEEILKYSEDKNTISKSSKNIKNLSESEIKINCITFLGAGFDTTSTALAFVVHILINYPEIQERVRIEVNELFEKEGKLDYNTVTKLQYMEWVINETLRVYPPLVIAAHRECATDYKYGDLTISKGTTVVMCTHFLHNDPDCWSEPEKFDPMRFSPERRHEIVTGSWHPFGDGPRKCIGSHFAYLNIKLTLANLLLKYSFHAGPHTEIGNLTIKYKPFTVVPKNGVFVRIVKIRK